jgi:hypothetical protein
MRAASRFSFSATSDLYDGRFRRAASSGTATLAREPPGRCASRGGRLLPSVLRRIAPHCGPPACVSGFGRGMASPEAPACAQLYVLVATDASGRPVKAVEEAEAAALERALDAQAPPRAASPAPLAPPPLLPKAEEAGPAVAVGDDAGELARQVALADALLTAAAPLAPHTTAPLPTHHAASAHAQAHEVRARAPSQPGAWSDTRAARARAQSGYALMPPCAS